MDLWPFLLKFALCWNASPSTWRNHAKHLASKRQAHGPNNNIMNEYEDYVDETDESNDP